MTERANNLVENFRDDSRAASAEDAITKIAGSLPSSMNELKETANVSRMMREGSTSSNSAAVGKIAENAVTGGVSGAISGALEKLRNGSAEDRMNRIPNGSAEDRMNRIPNGSAEDRMNRIPNGSAEDRINRLPDGHAENHANKDGHTSNAFKEHDGSINNLEKLRPEDLRSIFTKPEVIPSDKQGLMNLSTGDKFVRAAGVEVLVAPNGDTLVVNKDGSYDIGASKGVNIKHDPKSDTTTLTYPNGDVVRISKGHITDVERGFNSVHMNSRLEDLIEQMQKDPRPHPWHPEMKPLPWGPPHIKPLPWPPEGEIKPYPLPGDLRIPQEGGGGGNSIIEKLKPAEVHELLKMLNDKSKNSAK